MKRKRSNWLEAYQEYASITEAPDEFHLWAGLSTLAAATRRRVWVDMLKFDWVTNLYIIFVAPPGVVTKSTTIDIGKGLLHKMEGIKLGQESGSWQKLIDSLADAKDNFGYKNYKGKDTAMSSCSLTIPVGELGTFLKTRDGDMIDALTKLWDGQKGVFAHGTISRGDNVVENPWLNVIAATTPSWIATNFTENMIGGGFTSRVMFVSAMKKTKFIAYPDEMVHDLDSYYRLENDLIFDLLQISNIKGPMTITPEVREWGRKYYDDHWNMVTGDMASARYDGYRARKWTFIQKLAMLFSISRSNEKVITMEDTENALRLLGYSEEHLVKIFEGVNVTRDRNHVAVIERQIEFHGFISVDDLFKKVRYLMSEKDFEAAIKEGVRVEAFYPYLKNIKGKSVRGFSNEPMPHLAVVEGGKKTKPSSELGELPKDLAQAVKLEKVRKGKAFSTGD